MSRLSNSHLVLQLDPDGARATLRRGWLKPVTLATAIESAPARVATEPIDGAEGGAAALADVAMAALLSRAAPASGGRGLAVDVELADAFVHFDVAEGDFGRSSDQQLGAVAAACVREVLGDDAPPQLLRWRLQRDEQHLLVCALTRPLVDTLSAAIRNRGLRLRSLRPAFVPRWNRHRATLARGLGVFASCGPRHAVIAFVRDGVVEALASDFDPGGRPAADGLADEAAATLEDSVATRLDMQADRLIASLGVDRDEIAQFIVAAGATAAPDCLPRWKRRADATGWPS